MNESLSISPDVKFGTGVKLSTFINLYGCEVSDNMKIGAFSCKQVNTRRDGLGLLTAAAPAAGGREALRCRRTDERQGLTGNECDGRI